MISVRYMVKDVDAAVPFYTDFLGFEVVERWGPAVAILEKEGVQLWLSGPQSSAARPMPDGRQPESGGWNRMVVVVENLTETVATMRTAGVGFRNDIITGPGGKQIVADDPSGNPVELFEPA